MWNFRAHHQFLGLWVLCSLGLMGEIPIVDVMRSWDDVGAALCGYKEFQWVCHEL